MSLAKELRTFCMRQKSVFTSKKAKAEFAEKLEQKVLFLVANESSIRNHRNCTVAIRPEGKGKNKPTIMTKDDSEISDGS